MDDAIGIKRQKRFKDWQLVLTLAALTATAALIAGVYVWRQGSSTDEETVRVVTGVQFPYPEGWSEETLSDNDRAAGLVLKLESADSEASFLARTVIARTPQDIDMNKLAADSEAALIAEIDGFEPISAEVTTLGDHRAAEITYRQTGDTVAESFTVRMIIVPMKEQTFYLTVRSASADFSSVRSDGQQIVEEFLKYVSAAQQ